MQHNCGTKQGALGNPFYAELTVIGINTCDPLVGAAIGEYLMLRQPDPYSINTLETQNKCVGHLVLQFDWRVWGVYLHRQSSLRYVEV